MHLIIDSDPIVYRCGFAAERSEYHLVLEDKDGGLEEVYFAPGAKESAGAKMKKFLEANPMYRVVEKEHVVIPGTKEDALEAVRTQLYSIEKECRSHYGNESISRVSVILSGPGNYREGIAKLFPYKGNRNPDHKPFWYQAIRDYLTGTWGALVIHGREADDECSILAGADMERGLAYVVATIDKDLDQIPGEHYNYMKGVFYAQSEYDARFFFYLQSLTGDPTDGIPGCPGVGVSRGMQLLLLSNSKTGVSPTKGKPPPRSDAAPWEYIVWDTIVNAYRSAKARKKGSRAFLESDPAAAALETARLVKLQEYPGQLWNPPGIPDELLEEFRDDAN